MITRYRTNLPGIQKIYRTRSQGTVQYFCSAHLEATKGLNFNPCEWFCHLFTRREPLYQVWSRQIWSRQILKLVTGLQHSVHGKFLSLPFARRYFEHFIIRKYSGRQHHFFSFFMEHSTTLYCSKVLSVMVFTLHRFILLTIQAKHSSRINEAWHW